MADKIDHFDRNGNKIGESRISSSRTPSRPGGFMAVVAVICLMSFALLVVLVVMGRTSGGLSDWVVESVAVPLVWVLIISMGIIWVYQKFKS